MPHAATPADSGKNETVDLAKITVYIVPVEREEHSYTLEELAALVDVPRRTIRYYIQEGVVDGPQGAGRGARYGTRHVEQLLEVRKWQRAGLSLPRIRALLRAGLDTATVPPPPPRAPGSLEVWSHLVVADGVEVTIEPKRAGLTPEQVRTFAIGVMRLYERIRTSEE